MSKKWIERYENHALHSTMNSFESLLARVSNSVSKDDKSAQDDLERLALSHSFVRAMLTGIIPNLANHNTLNNINNTFVNASNELNAYLQNKNIGHLQNAINQLDPSLGQVKSLASPVNGKKDQTISSIVGRLAKDTNQVIDSVSSKKKEIETEIESLKRDFDSIKGNYSDLRDAIKQEKAIISNLAAQYQEQFSQAQENRQAEFTRRIEELRSKLDASLENIADDIEGHKSSIDKTLDEKLALIEARVNEQVLQLEDKNNQARRLLEAVGINTHAFSYAVASKDEGDAHILLRRWSVFFMIVSIVVLLAPAINNFLVYGEAFDWLKLLERLPIAFVLFVPAGYLAAEANQHRKMHIENKRIELELAALTPYLETLDDDGKKKIKAELIDKYFVGHTRPEPKQVETKEAKWIEEIVSKVIEKVLDRIPGTNR